VEEALRRLERLASLRPDAANLPDDPRRREWLLRLLRLLTEPIDLADLVIARLRLLRRRSETPTLDPPEAWPGPRRVDDALVTPPSPPPSPPPLPQAPAPHVKPAEEGARAGWPTGARLRTGAEEAAATSARAEAGSGEGDGEAPAGAGLWTLRSSGPRGADDDAEERWPWGTVPGWTLRWVAGAITLILLAVVVSRSVRVVTAPASPGPEQRSVRGERARDEMDSEYLAGLAGDIRARCTTWERELREAEEILSWSGVDPVRLTLRASDVFAGSRSSPRLLIEGRVRDPAAPFPLKQRHGARYAVRKFHDRAAEAAEGGGTIRTIEVSWSAE
jgi:hypothetical protein